MFVVCLLTVSFFVGAAKAADPKPVITLSISSYSALLDAGKAIATQVGQGDNYEMVQLVFGTLPGTDSKKPLGFVLFATDEEFLPVVFLPVGDLNKLTGQYSMIDSVLSEYLEEVSPGKYLLATGSIDLVLEQKKNWLILYPESHPKLAVADPSVFLNGLDKKYLLAIEVNFENTPKELVLQLISVAEMMMSMLNPEAAGQFATAKEQVELLLDEGKSLLEGFNVDPKTGDITIEVAMEVKPNGTLAQGIKSQKDGKTNFSGFYRPEQAAAFVGIGVIPDAQKAAQINQVESFFASAIEGVEDELEGDALEFVQGLLESLKEIVVATIEDGKTDIAASWKSTGEVFFAGRIAKGNQLSDVLKKVATGISEVTTDLEDLLKIEYMTFEGYKFSSLSVPLTLFPIHPGYEELFGYLEDKSICFLIGVKNDAVCGAFGTDVSKLEAILKKCISDSKTPAALPKTVLSFSLPLAAGAIQSLDLLPSEPVLDAVLDSLMSSPKDARITGATEITTSARSTKSGVEFKISGKVIAAIAKAVAAGNEAQMQSVLDSDPFEETPKPREKTRDFNF